MAKQPKTEEQPFQVPSLADVDAEYAALAERFAAIQVDEGKVNADARALDADLRKRPALRGMRSGVAELVGDVIEADERPAKLADLRKRQRDLAEAGEMLQKRLRDRRGAASKAVREASKAEYAKRVCAVCDALKVAHKAYADLDAMIAEFEAHDVEWTALGVCKPTFLGSVRDGHIDRYLKEMKGLGYAD